MSRGPSTRTRQRRTPGEATAVGVATAVTDAATRTDVVRDGFVLDFISGTRQLKETPKELVRQRIAYALSHEYGISADDMTADFPVSVGGRRQRVDIAIFGAGEAHEPENVQRVVVCRPEPKQNRRGAVTMRDYEQAAQDIAEVKPFFEEIEACRYALWTNGLEFFFLRKKATKFQVDAEPIGDWPPVDESIDDRNVLSRARVRRADPEMLRTAFRRCHNFIHGNEGMPKDAAFWQFLYLIFCKMYDERARRDYRRFWAGPTEQFTDDGRRAIRKRIEPLFGEVKQQFKSVFQGNEEISLSDRALAFMISELSKYEFARIDVDAKGAAYQEIVGTNLRGDRGQYFTPRGAIRLVVEILDPREDERLLDPACGTGGFLVATLAHRMERFRNEEQVRAEHETSEEFESLNKRLRRYAAKQVFGCDFDPFLIRASQMNMVMAGDGKGHLYHLNSLEFPGGHLPREVGTPERSARVRRCRDDQSALRVDDSDHRREHPPPLRSRARVGTDRGRRLPQHWATAGQRRARDPVHRTLSRLAPAWRAHGHRPAGRDPRQPGRGVHPLVDPAPRLGARQRGPSGGDLYRGSQRQHPHQPAVPEKEAGRGDDAGGDQRRRRLSDLHGGRGDGRFRSARQHAVPALARGGGDHQDRRRTRDRYRERTQDHAHAPAQEADCRRRPAGDREALPRFPAGASGART